MLFQAPSPHIHLYTELESFKKLGVNAPPALSCAFYEDLRAEKGIVLMRGNVSCEVRTINSISCIRPPVMARIP